MTKLELGHEEGWAFRSGTSERLRTRSQRLQSEMEIKIPDIDPLPSSGQKIRSLEERNLWLCKRYGIDLRMLKKWDAMGAPVLDYRLMAGWLGGRQFRD